MQKPQVQLYTYREYLPLLLTPILSCGLSAIIMVLNTSAFRFLYSGATHFIIALVMIIFLLWPVITMFKIYKRQYHVSFLTVCRIFSPVHLRRPKWAGTTRFSSAGGLGDAGGVDSIVDNAVLQDANDLQGTDDQSPLVGGDRLNISFQGFRNRIFRFRLPPSLKKDIILYFTAKNLYLCFMITMIFSLFMSDYVYWNFAFSNYEYRLNSVYYYNVNPSELQGGAIADAGIVQFNTRTVVNHTASYSILDKNYYCLAPIQPANFHYNDVYENRDFFAVGVNCCNKSDTNSVGFSCGDVLNHNAHYGMRLVRDDLRPFFYTAWEGWKAKFNIDTSVSNHPLFFVWTVDPYGYMRLNDEEIKKMRLLVVTICVLLTLFAGVSYRQVFK